MRRTSALPLVIASAVSLSFACGVAIADATEMIAPAPTAVAGQPAAAPASWNRVAVMSGSDGRLDPLAFFGDLVARYRNLTAYSDLTRIIQITHLYDDSEPQRTETHVACELADGKLSVTTPGSQLRSGVGLGLSIPPSPELEQAQRRFDLWLAPHMALKFTDKPLEELRDGVPEGFTATDAAAVTIDDRPMVHLELTSGDGLSGDYNARFDLYVDPTSMLIERIEGRQRLPDGGDFEATYHITPTMSEGGEPVAPSTLIKPPSLLPTDAAEAQPCAAPHGEGEATAAPCTHGKAPCTGPLG